jgi:hypothetical protein
MTNLERLKIRKLLEKIEPMLPNISVKERIHWACHEGIFDDPRKCSRCARELDAREAYDKLLTLAQHVDPILSSNEPTGSFTSMPEDVMPLEIEPVSEKDALKLLHIGAFLGTKHGDMLYVFGEEDVGEFEEEHVMLCVHVTAENATGRFTTMQPDDYKLRQAIARGSLFSMKPRGVNGRWYRRMKRLARRRNINYSDMLMDCGEEHPL